MVYTHIIQPLGYPKMNGILPQSHYGTHQENQDQHRKINIPKTSYNLHSKHPPETPSSLQTYFSEIYYEYVPLYEYRYLIHHNSSYLQHEISTLSNQRTRYTISQQIYPLLNECFHPSPTRLSTYEWSCYNQKKFTTLHFRILHPNAITLQIYPSKGIIITSKN